METLETDAVTVKMLGGLFVIADGVAVDLPPSRKARALFAYLLVAGRPVSRSDLCDLLWDGPSDPRAELRWCLSKLRPLFDGSDGWHLNTNRDLVDINLERCSVDVLELAAIRTDDIGGVDVKKLEQIASTFAGPFLNGLVVENCLQFDRWVGAERRKLEKQQLAVLQLLTRRAAETEQGALEWAERWLRVTPFDLDAHRALLMALIEKRQIGAADEHVEATIKLFQAEGLHVSALRELWRELRAGNTSSVQIIKYPNLLPEDVVQVEALGPNRVVLAIMPFSEDGFASARRGKIADGLTNDIITRLAKLRAFSVIARGSVYAIAERGFDPQRAGQALQVQYITSGVVEHVDDRAQATVELIEVETARIVWSEKFEARHGDLFSIMDEIVNSIVAAIASKIEMAERDRAILKPPTSLNAWEAYHRGLWHMYKFTEGENRVAADFFQSAIKLDPTFARAYSGLSFTHWQSAFQGWVGYDQSAGMAYEVAGQSLLIDSYSPESHWAMGRALWLMGNSEESLSELAMAVDLSPHFALGHYALAFVQALSGDPEAAILSADESRHLSPYDPLLFGMLGTRAMSHVRLGQYEEAAEWAIKAAARPNAHLGILAIAAISLGLAGRVKEGLIFASRVRASQATYTIDNFLHSFRFSKDGAVLFRKGAKAVGLE